MVFDQGTKKEEVLEVAQCVDNVSQLIPLTFPEVNSQADVSISVQTGHCLKLHPESTRFPAPAMNRPGLRPAMSPMPDSIQSVLAVLKCLPNLTGTHMARAARPQQHTQRVNLGPMPLEAGVIDEDLLQSCLLKLSQAIEGGCPHRSAAIALVARHLSGQNKGDMSIPQGR